jgi:hypothetical protein
VIAQRESAAAPPPLPRDLISEVVALAAAGYSIIPVDDSKRPLLDEWTSAQQRAAAPEELRLSLVGAPGAAVICGYVSGGLVSIDFDLDKKGVAKEPFDIEADFVDPWLERVADIIDTSKLPRQRTGSGGTQLFVRCPNPPGNLKLAKVPADNTQGWIAVIETRGEGGYAVIPPSALSTGAYAWRRLSLLEVPTVTQEQFKLMVETAVSLCRMPKPSAEDFKRAKRVPRPATGDNIFQLFNSKYHPGEILERNGYLEMGDRWLSPDSTSGNPGVWLIPDSEPPRVYSHHADALSDGHTHDAFDVYALLEHDGDKKLAARSAKTELASSGCKFTSGSVWGFAPKEESTVCDDNDLNQSRFGSKEASFGSNPDAGVEPPLWWGEMDDPKPVDWLVRDLIQDDAVNLLGGEPGAGKSMIAMDLLVAVASGSNFLGRLVKQGPALFINFDDGEGLPKDFARWSATARGLDLKDLPIARWQREIGNADHAAGLLAPKVVEEIKALLGRISKEKEPVRLIVVDAFSDAFPGVNGNDGPEVVNVFQHLQQLGALAGGAGVLLVDHTPKPSQGESKRRGVSGSQQKHAQSRTVNILSASDPIPSADPLVSTRTLSWYPWKVNAGEQVPAFGIRREITKDHWGQGVSVTFTPTAVPTTKPKTNLALTVAAEILRQAAGEWIKRQDLIKQVLADERVNVSRTTVENAIHDELKGFPGVQKGPMPGRGSPVGFRWRPGATVDWE